MSRQRPSKLPSLRPRESREHITSAEQRRRMHVYSEDPAGSISTYGGGGDSPSRQTENSSPTSNFTKGLPDTPWKNKQLPKPPGRMSPRLQKSPQSSPPQVKKQEPEIGKAIGTNNNVPISAGVAKLDTSLKDPQKAMLSESKTPVPNFSRPFKKSTESPDQKGTRVLPNKRLGRQ
ncbi:hypothetical protein EX30DRAFT_398855 [Ascodesmis nigricans]|uniref:Uncharacterized protein n=1 Tax=Ascodesmis nigricans TaxID=341454 RepID=A0A4S2MJH1_9PEZI|nr:hypothetical protein EX30DRAFT_398855 [Ascodesmis nigricans]